MQQFKAEMNTGLMLISRKTFGEGNFLILTYLHCGCCFCYAGNAFAMLNFFLLPISVRINHMDFT